MAALDKCDRAYFWRVFWSWTGWNRDASPSRKLAYALKLSTTGPAMAGKLTHSAMARLVRDARHCRPSNPEAHATEAIGELRKWAKQAEKTTPANSSKKRPMSAELYYGDPIDIDRAEETIRTCVASGARSEHIEAISEMTRDLVHVVDQLESFQLDGVDVWVAPDLCYGGARGDTLVVDWKTGRPRDTDTEQVKLYGLWAVETGRVESPDELTLSLAYLATGEVVEQRVTAADIEATRAKVLGFAAEVAALRDPVTTAPRMDAEAWPKIEQGSRACGWCEFRELCKR